MSSGFISISTKNKIRIARVFSKCICLLRKKARLPNFANVKRQECQWKLDLEEGIDLAIYLGLYEPHIKKALHRLIKEGNIVIDIGANIGAHTLPFSVRVKKTGKVIAIEATKFAYNKLLTNLYLNPTCINNVIPIHALLSNKKKIKSDFIPASWPLRSVKDDLDETHFGKNEPIGDARIVTLDELVKDLDLERVDLIKIDVDGNEIEVIQGGLETINKYFPKLIVEIAPHVYRHKKHGFEFFINLLRSLPYRTFSIETAKEISLYPENFIYGKSVDILMIHE